jgi:hypothetical protein
MQRRLHLGKKAGYRVGRTSVKKQDTELTLELGDVHHSSADHVDVAASQINGEFPHLTFQRNYISEVVNVAMEE